MIIGVSLIRSFNFSARVIHFGMWIWSITRGLPHKKCFNHSEFRYDAYSSGAVASGVQTRLWYDYITSYRKVEVTTYWITISPIHWDAVKEYLDRAEDRDYEFINFWWHLVKIIVGKWKGSKSSRKLYCYEHVIRSLRATGNYDIDIFMNPYQFREWADSNLV